jgi:hypothetical protein
MVSINVSKDKDAKTFLVHKEFICYYSLFFDAAFNGQFQEGATLKLDLPGVLPAVFDIFVNWLYTQTIAADTQPESHMSWLIELWILADRLLAPKLQNQVLVAYDKLRVALWCRPVIHFVLVYENTVQGSPLRRYITQIAASGFTVNDELTGPEGYTKDLLFDMVNFMRTGLREKWVEFSEEELKQFFVEEGEAEESQEERRVNDK